MRILGIIAEYDPFHLGHEKHLLSARKAISPSAVYIVLSPCFRQRGELAFLSPYARARCALASGADAVFALPVSFVLCSAEQYALGAVSLLSALGCTHLAFGAETEDLPLLMQAAALLEDPPETLRLSLRQKLDQGLGFPEARDLALREVFPPAGDLLSRPNNILAVSYLRAIRKLHLPLQPVLIPRRGDYHADRIDPENPSASALRGALLRGDWLHALPALPGFSRREVQKAFLSNQIPDFRILDHLLLSCLRSALPEQLRLLPDVSEGIELRLLQAAKNACSRGELLDLVSSRRYPRARISRLCAAALLGMKTAPDASAAPSAPPEALLLGLRRNPEITAPWRDLPLSVLSSLKESKHPSLWETDGKAWKIWAQCASLPDTLPFSSRLETL